MPAHARFSSTYFAVLVVAAATSLLAREEVTFARDIAPMLQQKCQGCHRPGTSAPMSLITYDDVRPWVRAIRQSVVRREMPPWPLAPNEVQRFKNDRSLTQAQIDLLVRWVDAGALLGDTKDLPAPVSWADADAWQSGTPDLILSVPARDIPPTGPDRWNDFIVDAGLTENRYIRAVETRPSRDGRPVVHHVVTFLVQEDSEADNSYLSEYALGKDVELFAPDSGRLMRAGAKLRINVHDHPTGRRITDRLQIGLFFHPKGTVPRHEVVALTLGLLLLDDALDIPPRSVTTHHANARLDRPARIISFQPHMHLRGRAMTLEAFLPDGRRTVLGTVDPFDFGTQIPYIYEDAAAPVLPAGTILHAAATYDNTARNRRNPDPGQWVGFGNRTLDEMFQCHVLMTYLDDTEYSTISRDGSQSGREP